MSTRAELEARAKELQVKFAAKISDEDLAANIKDAEAKAQPQTDAFEINCAVAGGRRRGGRRWPGGVTRVAKEDMTDEILAALDADPMFAITQRPAE